MMIYLTKLHNLCFSSLRSLMRNAGCRIRLPSKVDDIDDLIDIIAEGNDAIVERFVCLFYKFRFEFF